MLISQSVEISGFDLAADIAGLVGYRYGSGSTMTFGDAFDFGTLIGSNLVYDASADAWWGTVTKIQFYNNVWEGFGLNVQRTWTLTFETPLVVPVTSAAQTSAFFQQLMNAAGNTNTAMGGAGNDTLAATNQADILNGGSGGRDVVDYRLATQAIAVDLSGANAPQGAAATDTFISIEGIRGTWLNDTLRGNAEANLLDGGGGTDQILSSAGEDTLYGGLGLDLLNLTGTAGNLQIMGTDVTSNLAPRIKIAGFENYVTGDGNDTIVGKADDRSYVTNGGNDLVKLLSAAQTSVQTGAGNDTVEVWASSTAALDLGEGTDSVVVSLSGPATLTVTTSGVGAGSFSGAFGGTFSGLDVLTSSNVTLNYFGHEGRDEVWAGLGNDTLQGGNGDDVLYGGTGNDILRGDDNWGFQGGSDAYGSDFVDAGGGNDLMLGAKGNDIYIGGAGNDTLSYAELADDYYGDYSITLNSNNTITKNFTDWYGDTYPETDTIQVSDGNDIEVIVGTGLGDMFDNTAGTSRSYRGGGGADTFYIRNVTAGETVLDLGLGADVLRVRAETPVTAWLGGNWAATVQSDSIATVTYVTQGWNIDLSQMYLYTKGAILRNESTTDGSVMIGTALDDRFESASGLDVMTGGAGSDTYVVTITSGAFPIINEAYGALGTDTIITSADGLNLGDTIENVTLLEGALSVWGNAQANLMIGNRDNNVFHGGGGADTMQGGEGNDTYYVTGIERIVESAYVVPFIDPEFGWFGDPYRDRVISSASFVMKQSGLEDLTLIDGALDGTGNLQGNGISGNTLANTLRGQAGDDTLIGLAGADTLLGGTENDSLAGGGGADSLRGDAGNDTLLGGDGADVLAGGAGVNRLTGGAGADQFLFIRSGETTTVTDWTDGVDKLVFSPQPGLTVADLLAGAVQNGAHVTLTTPGGTVVTVLRATVAELVGDVLIV